MAAAVCCGWGRFRLRRKWGLQRLTLRNVFVAAVAAGVLVFSLTTGLSGASAAVRSGGETFDPNQPGPTFGNPPRLPLIAISVAYDDQVGTITVSESGGDPSYGTGWAWFDHIYVGGTNSPVVSIDGYWDYPFVSPMLADSAVNGSLAPSQVTKSADGSTITMVWSDPALAHQPLTFVRIVQSDQPDNNCFCDVEPAGSFYFAGYEPSMSIQNPGSQSTEVGTPLGLDACGGSAGPCCRNQPLPSLSGPCPGLQISAEEINLSNGAFGDDEGSDGTEQASSYAASGLPPGLSISQAGMITGRPTASGSYPVTITATGDYNDQQQRASASTQFTWTIAAPPAPPPPPRAPVRIPHVPTFDGAPYHGKGLSIKPSNIVYTGDGTGALAGAAIGHRRRPRWRSLHWSSWTTTDAHGSGKDWVDNCKPDCAGGTFTGYEVRIHLYRPKYEHGHEVFTRMTLTFPGRRPRFQRHRTWTLRVVFSRGTFGWA